MDTTRLSPLVHPVDTRPSSADAIRACTMPQKEEIVLPKNLLANKELQPCGTCKRTFESNRIAYHERVCKRTDKKRRPFNSTKQRLSGFDEFEMSAARKRGRGKSDRGVSLRNAPVDTRLSGAYSWRRQHAALIAFLRAYYSTTPQKEEILLPKNLLANEELQPCGTCKRTFESNRIAYHERVCKRTDKKRRPFNSTKQRLSGFDEFEMSAARKRGRGKSDRGVSLRNAPVDTRLSGAYSWRRQHAALIAAIRAFRT